MNPNPPDAVRATLRCLLRLLLAGACAVAGCSKRSAEQDRELAEAKAEVERVKAEAAVAAAKAEGAVALAQAEAETARLQAEVARLSAKASPAAASPAAVAVRPAQAAPAGSPAQSRPVEPARATPAATPQAVAAQPPSREELGKIALAAWKVRAGDNFSAAWNFYTVGFLEAVDGKERPTLPAVDPDTSAQERRMIEPQLDLMRAKILGWEDGAKYLKNGSTPAPPAVPAATLAPATPPAAVKFDQKR